MPVLEELASKQRSAVQEEGTQASIPALSSFPILHREGSRLEHIAWSSYH